MKGMTVESAESFEYLDPVDKSVSANQGIKTLAKLCVSQAFALVPLVVVGGGTHFLTDSESWWLDARFPWQHSYVLKTVMLFQEFREGAYPRSWHPASSSYRS